MKWPPRANQPVRHLASGRVYITSQNHGYAVVGDTLPQGVRLSMVNANDGSCEGLEIPALRAFSTLISGGARRPVRYRVFVR